MFCKYCGNEMLVHHTEEKENTLIFHYKCANPACAHYGYANQANEPVRPEDDSEKESAVELNNNEATE